MPAQPDGDEGRGRAAGFFQERERWSSGDPLLYLDFLVSGRMPDEIRDFFMDGGGNPGCDIGILYGLLPALYVLNVGVIFF